MKLSDYQLNDTKVFRDVIHGYITVDLLPIWRLINTKEFQRLRRIKQLGGACHVFPTAEHSRFVHSLGVYEIIRQMIEKTEIKDYLTDYEKLTVLAAGLLHDIGHGPFSHSFEETFLTCSHEDMTIEILLKDTEIHQILEDVDPHLPKDVASVINHTHPNEILIQMITSQLDGDRMDYLLRDSYFAGVTYGEFDKERILRTLRIKNNKIVFKSTGVQAIEDYILARYHMYWQVYYHPTCKSYELVFKSICTRLKDLANNQYTFKHDYTYLKPFFINKVTLEDYLFLDEPTMMHYIKKMIDEEDQILSDLADRLVNRHLFKSHTMNSYEDVEKIKQLSKLSGYHPDYYVFTDDTIQIPYFHYHDKNVSEIEIVKENGEISPLPKESEIVHAIINSTPKRAKRVFYVKEINSKEDTND